ncbi:cytochrome c oxidase subunit II [Sulfurovum sp. zt1-1]|uniref:Cytochrome c oxidase subunit 2 n=1 Tax=Sulfurovum zhangzhouensis TaxID=3019067 RepID=A0ABT7QYJ2_9BACT|nr:cytochrome c oxidase subunit II [Sulfurovum zhangzhouensis]MDM5271909.1 cytochrome c oxidase subunit II [Sulfurovum zhangzhouensis]
MLEGFAKEASTFAADVDRAFWITIGINTAMLLLVVGLILFFILRYHHSRVQPKEIRNIKDHIPLEIAWTVIPTIILFVIFYYGYSAFRQLRTMPQDAFIVDVLGKRWSWTFTYPNGKRTAELYIPVGENIKLRLHAPENDVLHSFYVPAFRVKEDVVPGRVNHLWFKITEAGRYDVQCAEYCGTRHSYMLSKVEAMDKDAFDTWYASDKLSPHDESAPKGGEGEILYKTLGCASCHSLDGSIIVGPSFKGLFGSMVKVMTDGKPRELTANEAYIRDSVRTPAKDVVEGFPVGIMPNLSDQINEEQMNAIIAFIKTQSSEENNVVEQPAVESVPASVNKAGTESKAEPEVKMPIPTEVKEKTPDGATLFSTKGCIGCHSLDGSQRIGPSLKGIYQSTQKVVTDGKLREVVADEAYLHHSIENPNADIVEGFPPGLMPQFGKMLSSDEIDALVEYLKGVK